MAAAKAPTTVHVELARQIVNRQMSGKSQSAKDKAVRELAALIASGHGLHG
ncbi:hypothetical protein [Actinocatenispora sera]|uniref:Uncharacterized protein n=1 Tax=Actinocatenispora sera TaxID=390989 RepID=A0A810L0B2_9ACTN|nr:hypothetical protein [Actinocatenispora sera]BCJ27936.1 hypothetical protein Asera_20440 [Actinocatenispora sera]